MNRAISSSQLKNTKFNVLDFDGRFEALIGKPELKGAWLVWGQSGNGKTSFVLQLAKYMTRFGRVIYDSLEEGNSLSMQMAFDRVNMWECGKKVLLLDQEPIEELKIRLERRKSPNIIVIDSLQYSGLSYKDYKELRDQFKNKLFITISHANGSKPTGRVAERIKFDAFAKIWVEGFKASAESRYLKKASEPYIISEHKAQEYWSQIN